MVAGLALHGLFDLTRHLLISAHGVPEDRPAFCMAFDLAAPAVLAAILLFDKRGSALPEAEPAKGRKPLGGLDGL